MFLVLKMIISECTFFFSVTKTDLDFGQCVKQCFTLSLRRHSTQTPEELFSKLIISSEGALSLIVSL